MNHLTRRVGTAVLATAVAVSLTACGSSTSESSSSGSGGAEKKITLGILPAWTDGLSTAYLWKKVLEDKGYQVEITELSEAAPLYTGVANGDIDVYPSAWPEVTHAAYMEQYGPKLEDLGKYYDNAKLTFAVPEYSSLNSIADLKGKGSQYDGKIIGIEPGAGLTKVTKDSVLPKYGLTGEYKLVESSTTAMLAELKKATDAKKDIVVTLWRPFWANETYKVKDLKDPEQAFGKPEALHEIATKGFKEKHPEVADMMGKFKLTDAQYASLENKVVNEFGKGKEPEAVDAWLKENPGLIG